MASIRSSYCKNLHAKCFLNESEALITSMNLYEFSQVNNEEMGILISKASDPELYGKVYEEANRLLRISEELRVEVQVVNPSTSNKAPAKKPTPKTNMTQQGHCIRCAATIPFSMERPLCDKDYKIWARYEDPEYPEDYCHSCGKERDTTYDKPLCGSCFKSQAKINTKTTRSIPPWFRKKKSV